MLTQLLQLMAETQRSCQIEELSRTLHAQPSAVEAMLETLVQRGRVVAIDGSQLQCAECALRGKCDLPAVKGRRYVLASPVVCCRTLSSGESLSL